MKKLINIIQEKLVINKHSKIKNDYYLISGKEFSDLIKIFSIKDDLKDLKLQEYNNHYINIYTHYNTSELFVDGIYLGGFHFYIVYTSNDPCFAIQIYRNGGEPILIIFATNEKDIERLTEHLTKNKWTKIKDTKEIEKIYNCFKI